MRPCGQRKHAGTAQRDACTRSQSSPVRRRGHLANRPAKIQASEFSTAGPNSGAGGGKQTVHSGLLHMHAPVGAQSSSFGAIAFSKKSSRSFGRYMCGSTAGSCIGDWLLASSAGIAGQLGAAESLTHEPEAEAPSSRPGAGSICAT